MEEQTGMRREREEGSIHTQLTSLGLSIMSGGHLESLFRGNQKLRPRRFQPPPLTSVTRT